MLINYWDCPFRDYDEIWDGEEEIRIYGCKHPTAKTYGVGVRLGSGGISTCPLDNKWGKERADCTLLDLEETP